MHHALQSKLAYFFVEVNQKYNIQIIVETHSEYLIRKLQFLTGKGDLTTGATHIYYFYHLDYCEIVYTGFLVLINCDITRFYQSYTLIQFKIVGTS